MLYVDEKSPVRALTGSPPVLPMTTGMPKRQTHGYVYLVCDNCGSHTSPTAIK